MQALTGIHHITAFAGDPQRNVDFYHRLLGQRLVKTTVNFDDPGTYHFYFADKIGTPGTIMTFFPWPHAVPGRRGNGEAAAVAYRIGAQSVAYWQKRLADHNVAVDLEERFGAPVLTFSDPEGMPLELIVDEEPAAVEAWPEGPIPVKHALRGFHGVTLWVTTAEGSARLLTERLGFTPVGEAGNRLRFRAAAEHRARFVDLLVRPEAGRGRMGAGSVHHVAFRARDDAEQVAYQQELAGAGFGVTEVKDRQYFRSIYFREPSGVLYEIATDDPGFAIDEEVAALGRELKLPPWLEAHRSQIEAALPRFTIPEVSHA